MNHNNIIVNCDTDSITICKDSGEPFSKDEQIELIKEINSILPEKIQMDHDGIYDVFIVVRAKNYVMVRDGKIKYKGSSLKATTKCAALKQFIKDVIDTIIEDRKDFTEIYHSYVREVMNIKDIKRWAAKKTITEAVLNPKRTNEQKVYDIIQDTEYSQGDKIYTFYLEDESLCLVENFTGQYDKLRLLENLNDTAEIFAGILDTETLFPKYHRKKKDKAILEAFLEVQKE